MNYYYDIILNWSEDKAYDFYEWNDFDSLELIKKIPLFKIKHKAFLDIATNSIKVDQKFLELIADKTLVSDKKNFKRIEYACLFTDTKNVYALEFDKEGNSISRSKLLVDDELNVLECIYGMKETQLEYVVKENLKMDSTLRQIKEAKKLIVLEINNLYQNKDIAKLKYLYYEYKKENIDDIDYIYEEIMHDLNKEFNEDILKLYYIIKLSYQGLKKVL